MSDLTDEQREVVERVRANTERLRQEGLRRAREVQVVRIYDPEGARAAAIAAHDERLTFAAAAARHNVTGEAARKWYHRLYPNEPRNRGRPKVPR